MDNNELYSFGDLPVDYLMHYGTKGMKWGIRRYQNKDGSLTPAGRKRYAKLEAEMKKLSGDKTAEQNKPKRAKDMTDEELRNAVSRMRLEDEYNQMYGKLNPAKVKNGKKYVDSLVSSAVNGVAEGGKQLIRDALIKKGKEALGLNDSGVDKSMEKLKKQAEMMGYKQKIAIANNYLREHGGT